MSWLTPKRRRTTGALNTLNRNGASGGDDGNSPQTSPSSAGGSSYRPRPPSRKISQPLSMNGFTEPSDGNLFYAYARRVRHRKTLSRL